MQTTEIGSVHFSLKEDTWSLACNALAYDGTFQHLRPALLISGVGHATSVKAIAAGLSAKGGVRLHANIPGFVKSDDSLLRYEGGYNVHRSRLGYDKWHMLAIARDPSLIPAYSREALWQKLSGDQFTTPMLESWLPYIEERMLQDKLLRELHCWQCEARRLYASDEALDKIVSEGVKGGQLALAA